MMSAAPSPNKKRMVTIAADELARLQALAEKVGDVGKSPNQWKPGDKPEKPFKGKHVTLKTEELKSAYPLIISTVVPRPIAFVSSCLPDGSSPNLSPYSYFNCMGHDPPIISLGCSKTSKGEHKDSFTNIDAANSFCVNIISEWMVEAANATCGLFPRNVDEFGVGFTKAPCVKVPAPRVEESAVSLECVVKHKIDIGNSTVVLAEVVAFHVQEELLDLSHTHPSVKFEGYRPVSRLNGNNYGHVTEWYEIKRPDSKAFEQWPKST